LQHGAALSHIAGFELAHDTLNTLAVVAAHHFTLFAQYAAELGPLAMFFEWRALNDLRFWVMRSDSPDFGLPAVEAPCSPKRMIRSWPS
jgi:hypothetical protein